MNEILPMTGQLQQTILVNVRNGGRRQPFLAVFSEPVGTVQVVVAQYPPDGGRLCLVV
jgi:hypothetical protein